MSSIESSAVPSTESITVSTTASTAETTTAESTTVEPFVTSTTSQSPPETTYIINPGFDASPVSMEPWGLTRSDIEESFDIDGTIQHEGPNSGRITLTYGDTNYIRQALDPGPGQSRCQLQRGCVGAH
ncbi:hypothetical protein NW757_004742 [Fusarium falciforme]|nr:hypothetical protein NW757_004742 [Fusarium falciforme]